MNKKIDEEFKYIHDEYFLQCICTEMKDKIIKLKKENKKLKKDNEFLKNSSLFFAYNLIKEKLYHKNN